MVASRVAQRKKQLLELLKDDKVRTIVLFGESGIGKTWTARQIGNLARKRGSIDIALWVFLNRKYDLASLCYSMACQLLSGTAESEVEDDNTEPEEEKNLDVLKQKISTAIAGKKPSTGESEVEDDNLEPEEEKNLEVLKLKISAAIEGKKLLLVLDDEGNKMDENQIMSQLETLLNLNQRYHKVLITRCSLSNVVSEGGKILVKVEPLTKEESLSLLQKRAGTVVYDVPGIKNLAEDLIEKTGNMPAAIVLMAKAFSYFARQDSGLQMLKRSLEEVSGNEIYNITHLLRSGYDLLPNSVLIDCCWGGSLFPSCRRFHYNELIAYWILEGYLGRINCMEEAYERGHQVLLDLIDCQILKEVEADYIIMEVPALNLEDIVMDRSIINLDDCYRRGFCGTASLGLANNMFGDGKWEGIGRITWRDGVLKTPGNGKQGQKIPTSLLDGDSLSREFLCNFSESQQEHQVLALFNPPQNTLPPSSFKMDDLCVLVLRGCHYLEKIDQVDHNLNFRRLTVLEISGSSSLLAIPDEFFKHMPHLMSLHLSELQVASLPSSLYELSELSWLILRECSQLETLNSLIQFKKLMVLDLSGATSLRNVQDRSFSQNQELRMLNFSKTRIKSLPSVNSLQKLTHLLLSGCSELTRLRGINSVTALQVLDLSDASNFKEFHDESLEGIKGLKILDLSGTSVDHLPYKISNPRHLYLKGCTGLQNLSCVETLNDLESLDLSKAHFKTLPSLSRLCKLRRLFLSNCSKLEKLPDLNSLLKLEVLDLSGCVALKELQYNFFEQMSCLWRLDLSETKIKYLPSLSNLCNLCHLLLKKCTTMEVPPQLESLSKLEELNLCGISILGGTGADFLKNMSHLLILDLSETLLQQLPSLSNLKNLRQLYLRGCPSLKSVPGLEALTKLEVLDLSGTAVDHLPSFENFSNLRQPLLRDCPGEMHHLLGVIVEEHLDLPNTKNTEGTGSSKVTGENQYCWAISILQAEIVGDNIKHPVSLSSSQFLQLMENNQSLWTNFKKFHLSVHPIEEQDKNGAESFYRDDFTFRDIYFRTRLLSDFEKHGSLEIRGFHHSPKGIEVVLCHADYLFLIDNAFERWLSDLDASNLKVLKGCWIERCREMECVFYEEEVEEVVKLRSLEVLCVSNSVNLKRIYCGNWQSDTFQNLKRLYLDCCPKLPFVFSSSQMPINLQVLQIKFCDELVAVFEQTSPEPKLPYLDTLNLWELPKLESIGCALPSLQNLEVWKCPNLSDLKGQIG